MLVTRNVRMKYMAPAGEDGADGGGSGSGGDGQGAGGAGGSDEAAAAAAAAAAAGGKKPTDEEARLLKENMKKKEELKKVADQNATLQAQLKTFEGIDPEAVRKLLADQKAAEEKQLEAKGDFDRLKARMAEEHGKEVTTLKAQLEALQSQLGAASGTINELTIGTQFGQSSFISEELTLTPAKARVVYANHFDLEEGKVVGYDKPRGAANRTALVDQYGAPVPFDAALRKIVDADPDKEQLYRSKIKAGAGSDSKKVTGQQPQSQAGATSVSKIASGLGSLKIGV